MANGKTPRDGELTSQSLLNAAANFFVKVLGRQDPTKKQKTFLVSLALILVALCVSGYFWFVPNGHAENAPSTQANASGSNVQGDGGQIIDNKGATAGRDIINNVTVQRSDPTSFAADPDLVIFTEQPTDTKYAIYEVSVDPPNAHIAIDGEIGGTSKITAVEKVPADEQIGITIVSRGRYRLVKIIPKENCNYSISAWNLPSKGVMGGHVPTTLALQPKRGAREKINLSVEQKIAINGRDSMKEAPWIKKYYPDIELNGPKLLPVKSK